ITKCELRDFAKRNEETEELRSAIALQTRRGLSTRERPRDQIGLRAYRGRGSDHRRTKNLRRDCTSVAESLWQKHLPRINQVHILSNAGSIGVSNHTSSTVC